jgi:SAM-dependent methyltransferase
LSARACLVCSGGMTPAGIPGLARCTSCGFVTADLDLGDEELAALYGERYFCGEEYADYIHDRSSIEKSFSRRLRALMPLVVQPDAKHLFEIGSAYGFFLNLVKPLFGSVSGIDISSAAVEFARSEFGLRVLCGDVLSSELEEDVDVACMWDTIEHLRRPDLYLAWLSKRMRPGSLIAITTGDIESRVARWRGAKWRQIHPPTHLHYFSRKTLGAMLAKYGFQVRIATYDGMYRSLEMMSYIVLSKRHNLPGIHGTLKRLGVLDLEIYLNLRDIVLMIAEKTA